MGWLTEWRRRRVLARHRIDERLWREVLRSLPFLRSLPDEARRRLREQTLLFLAEKSFSGARGLTVTDAMRVSIAVQACLPVLELGPDAYAGWSGIVVYPGDFRVRVTETDPDGVVHEFDDERAGESWPGGPVILSWDAARNAPGMNVVIHEFAHKLDMANGEADGMPPLRAGMDRHAWREAFRAAYEGFCDAVDRGRDTWLDPYAAESPGEFFAVMSEMFFTEAAQARRRYPDVYDQLKQFYGQDPAAWRSP
ncbi:MAG TPA: M90 family metallopeptidase [Burkholderiales bacterium]|nr:M90 family metallopeptidase [Burkholderiales bacterium]